MCESGVREFAPVSIADLNLAMSVLAKSDALLMVHAEDPSLLLPPAADAVATRLRDLARDPACAGGDEGG